MWRGYVASEALGKRLGIDQQKIRSLISQNGWKAHSRVEMINGKVQWLIPRKLVERFFRIRGSSYKIVSLKNRTITEDQQERFWSFVEKTSDCWLWKGKRLGEYGGITFRGRLFSSHRLSYAIIFGRIPKGFFVDHVCRVKLCVNPDHLDAVTPQENIRRIYLTAEEHRNIKKWREQ